MTDSSDYSDSLFHRTPWTRRLLTQPDMVYWTPGARNLKDESEDSLLAETFKTLQTIRSCVCIHARPKDSEDSVEELFFLMHIGSGLNGHPHIMHGGVIATIIDLGISTLWMVNAERAHALAVSKGERRQDEFVGAVTAGLNVQYKKPVSTPGLLLATVRYARREGRKEFMSVEVKQREIKSESEESEETICAIGEGMMILPRPGTKL